MVMPVLTIMAIFTEIHTMVLRLKGQRMTDDNKKVFIKDHAIYSWCALANIVFLLYLLFTEFWTIGVAVFALTYVATQINVKWLFWVKRIAFIAMYCDILTKLLGVSA